MTRSRAEVAADIVQQATKMQESAQPYDNRNVLVPVANFAVLTLLVRELKELPLDTPVAE